MGQVTGTGTIFIKSNFQQLFTGKTFLQAHASDTELHIIIHIYIHTEHVDIPFHLLPMCMTFGPTLTHL